MTDLRLRSTRQWWWTVTEVIDADPDTLASVGFSVVAITLAEPLRRAFRAHLDEHGCGTGNGLCSEAEQLWDLLPDGDKICLA